MKRLLLWLALGGIVAPQVGAAQRSPRADAVASAVAVHDAAGTRRVTGALLVDASESISGDVVVFNGPVTVNGRVLGTLVAINADVRLARGAVIGKDLIVVGGSIEGREIATIGGTVRTSAEVLHYRVSGDSLIAEADGGWLSWPSRTATVAHTPNSWRPFSVASAHTYNRVEGLPILLGPRVHRETGWGEWWLDAFGIVRTAGPVQANRGTLGYDLTTEVKLGQTLGAGIGGRLFDAVDAVESWQATDAEVGLASFVLKRDYRDYYGRHGGEAFLKLHAGRDADLTLAYGRERWASLDARTPVTLFHQGDDWRVNPRMDDGAINLASARLRIDTRRREGSGWRAGWYADASLERGEGTLVRDPSAAMLADPALGALAFRAAPVRYVRGFVDARRYNQLRPSLALNVRAVLGGWLGGDPLPTQRRLSVGGPQTLPGFDFRDATATAPDILTCGGGALPGSPAQCDRVALFQTELRGDFHIGWVRTDARDDWWRPGLNGHATWVLFADAGRGWRVGNGPSMLFKSQHAFPGTSTFGTDAGFGFDFGSLGIYLAKDLSGSRQPMNIFVRTRHRF